MEKMRSNLQRWDIIYLTEVTASAPIERFCSDFLKTHTAKPLIKMPTNTERSAKSSPQKHGAVLFNHKKVKCSDQLDFEEIVPKEDWKKFDRRPFTFLFETTDYFKTFKLPKKFLISGIHGDIGLLS